VAVDDAVNDYEQHKVCLIQVSFNL